MISVSSIYTQRDEIYLLGNNCYMQKTNIIPPEHINKFSKQWPIVINHPGSNIQNFQVEGSYVGRVVKKKH